MKILILIMLWPLYDQHLHEQNIQQIYYQTSSNHIQILHLKSRIPNERKKASVVPINKKDEKQEFKNYGPVSLLPINGEMIYLNLPLRIILYYQTNQDLSPWIHA